MFTQHSTIEYELEYYSNAIIMILFPIVLYGFTIPYSNIKL